MNPTEIEAMLVRIMGDATSYTKSCKDSVEETTKLSEHVEKHAEHIKKVGERVHGYGETIVKNLASIGIAIEAWKTIEVAERVERNMRRLDILMKSHGENVEKVTKEYKDFAAQMTNVSMQSKGEIINLLRMAETYGLTGDAAKKAAHDAIALAAMTEGISPESLVRNLANAHETGNKMMLARMLGLRGMKDEAELNRRINERVAQGMEVLAGDMQTVEGQTKKMQQSFSYLTLEIGQTFLPVVQFLVNQLHSFVNWINNLDKGSKTLIVTFLITAAAIQPIKGAIAALLWVFGPAITVVRGFVVALLTLRTTVLTQVIPALAAGGAAMLQFLVPALAVVGVVGSVAIVGTAFYKLGEALSGTSEDYKNYNAEVERSIILNNQLEALLRKGNIGALERVKAAPTREEGVSIAEEEIRKAEVEIGGMERNLKRAREEVEELDTRFKRWTGNKELERAKMEAEAAAKRLAVMKEGVTKLKDALAHLTAPDTDPTNQRHLKDLNDKLKEEIALYGMVGHEREIGKLALKGMSEEALAEARANAAALESMKEETRAMEEHDKEVKKVTDSIEKLNEQLAEEAMELSGLTKEQLKLQKLAEEMKKAGMSEDEIRDQIEAFRVRMENNKALKEGAEIAKKHKDSIDELDDEYRKLVDLLNRGTIEPDVFVAAAQDIEERFNEITNSVKKTREEIKKLDGVLYGSAEAKFRIQAFHELDLTGGKPKKPKAEDWWKVAKDIVTVRVTRDEEERKKEEKANDLLKQIRDAIIKSSEAAGEVGLIIGAGFGGA